jgi:hypothetical protein
MTGSMERSSPVTLLCAEYDGVFGEQQVGGDAEGFGDREDPVDRDAVLADFDFGVVGVVDARSFGQIGLGESGGFSKVLRRPRRQPCGAERSSSSVSRSPRRSTYYSPRFIGYCLQTGGLGGRWRWGARAVLGPVRVGAEGEHVQNPAGDGKPD